mmetsp:Transcript_5755/g.11104  ORF Transcript_5755/g.11104 Transcript_5755/m.11104 type:complete len:534 (+) Transcript_5755:149-1750(+)
MDQYEKIETIGSGAFGKVCKIRRKSDNKILVWKELNYGAMNEQEKQQLVSEVNILRELRNPFIVRYYDRIVDKKNTRLYIVMEHCPGGDLGRVIKKCRRDHSNLDESIIWKIFSQSIVALKDCHRRVENGEKKPILHRDLKPANMMLDQNENIKIGDFGLAKELSSGSKLAQTNVGTPFYMSPELINGKQYGEKSDVWSLGCLLYELASLRPPFDATNQLQLAVKINAGKFHRIPNKYSDELNSAIRAMLQVDPNRRPRIESLENIAGIKNSLRMANGIMQEYQFQQTYTQKMREFKTMEDSLQARSEALSQKEAELKQKEAQLAVREQKVAAAERAVVASKTAATGAHRNSYQYIMPACEDGEEVNEDEDSSRRMSIQMTNDDEDESCQPPPPPVQRGTSTSAPFQIFNDTALPVKKNPFEGINAGKNNTGASVKENVYQYQPFGGPKQTKYDNGVSKNQSNFRQPPPPPLPFKKFQHLKNEGKGRQDKDGGSATKKQRHGAADRDRAALQSLVTNKPVFGAKHALRKFESL